jgi:hypothetical protein
MSDLERLPEKGTSLQELVSLYAVDVPTSIKPFPIPNLGEGTLWRATRYFGVEVDLEDGGTGQFIARQVEQLPDEYTAADSRRMQEFEATKLSGILADSRWFSAGVGHLSVGRRSTFEAQNEVGTTRASMSSHLVRQVGRTVVPKELNEMTAPNHVSIARSIEPDKIIYDEPSTLEMIWRGIRKKR